MFKFLIFFGLACIANATAKQTVDITVYYEPLCPDSRAFFKNQLVPTYHDLYQAVNLNLKLIPFGKAEITDKNPQNLTLKCTHGPTECYADKVHACAINIYGKTEQKNLIEYLGCLMTIEDTKDPYPTEKCTTKDISIRSLQDCANTTQVTGFLLQNEMDTKNLSPPLTSVPTIVFKNKFNEDDNVKSKTNFKGILCKYIDSPKPEACYGVNGAPAVTAGGAILFLSLALNMLR